MTFLLAFADTAQTRVQRVMGIDDRAMAVREARRSRHAVFVVTRRVQSKAHLARILGFGGFIILRHAGRLPIAPPKICRQLVGA